jgi:CRISPR type IV-associated protein Csf2
MKTLTLKLKGRIFIPNGYTTKWPGKDGELPSIDGKPIIPFSQIKGGWRRSGVRAIVEASGKKLPDVASYYFNVVGGVKGKKNDEDAKRDTSLSAYQAMREKNPVTGLFGSGDVLGSMYAGRLYGNNGMPDGDLIRGVFGGVRADDARRDPDSMADLLSSESMDADVAEMHRINRERTAIKGDINKLKRCFADKTLDAGSKKKLSDAIKEKEKALDDLGGSNAVSMPLEGFPYVIAKSFTTSLTLLNVTLVELGLLLAAMDTQMRTAPFLGGHKTYGFGEFSAIWDCAQGRVTQEPFVGATVEGDLFLEAQAAFLAAVDSFDLSKEKEKSSVVQDDNTSQQSVEDQAQAL